MQQRYTQATDFWQERDFGQKISATFEFIGAHLRPLSRVLLYLVVPAALVQSILIALLQSRIFGPLLRAQAEQSSYRLGTSYYNNFTSPLYLLSNVMSTAFHSMLILSIYGYLFLCLYPPAHGGPIQPADVWEVVRRKFWGTFFSIYGVGLLLLFAFVVLLVPGIYLSVVLSLYFIVNMVEGTDFLSTISRCSTLIKGKWWSTCGLLFVMVGLIYVLFLGFGIVAGITGAGLRGAELLSSSDNFRGLAIAISAISTLLSLLLYPPILLAIAFQYFNLVERHEGVGMHHLVSQLGQAPAASPDPTSYHPTEEGEY